MGKTLLIEENDSAMLNLEERVESNEESSYSLLSNSNDNTNNDDLIANFYTKLSQNGGKIIEVVSYPLSDRDERYKKIQGLSSLKGYAINLEVKVRSIDFDEKKGFVRINKQLDMPLINTRLNNYPMYFYDRQEAEKLVHVKNVETYEIIQEAKEHYVKASEFMKSVVDNKYL